MSRLIFAVAGALAVQALSSGPAAATAGMGCAALDDSGAAVEMNLPRAAGTQPNWVRVHAGGELFSSLSIDDDATPIHTRQSFDAGDTFDIDLTGEGHDEATIRIRLLRAEEGDEAPVYIGYLHVVGEGIHPITCTEDE